MKCASRIPVVSVSASQDRVSTRLAAPPVALSRSRKLISGCMAWLANLFPDASADTGVAPQWSRKDSFRTSRKSSAFSADHRSVAKPSGIGAVAPPSGCVIRWK